MKKPFVIIVALLCAANALFAQAFTPSSGYSSEELFNLGLGFSISALEADSNGDLYYLASGDFGGGVPDTHLFRRTAALNWQDPVSLFNYGTPAAGSFIKLHDGTVYFSESDSGTVRTIAATGGSSSLLTTIPGAYDLGFYGGEAYLSANLGGWAPEGQVYKMNLGTGALTAVFNPGGDYSGPIALDAQGNLIYGSTAWASLEGEIYRIAAALLDGETVAGIGDAESLFAPSGNQYLALLPGDLLAHALSPFGDAARLTLFDLNSPNDTGLLLGETGVGEFFGGLAFAGGGLFVAVSSDTGGPSAVHRVVPEPSTAMLLVAGLIVASLSRRGRRAQSLHTA